jgi:hypothetical protein
VAEGAVLLKNAEAGLGAQGLIVLSLGLRLSPDRRAGGEKKQGAQQEQKRRFLSGKHWSALIGDRGVTARARIQATGRFILIAIRGARRVFPSRPGLRGQESLCFLQLSIVWK